MRNGLFYNFLCKEMVTSVLHVCVFYVSAMHQLVLGRLVDTGCKVGRCCDGHQRGKENTKESPLCYYG